MTDDTRDRLSRKGKHYVGVVVVTEIPERELKKMTEKMSEKKE
jgi:hypothetical protein